MRRGLGGPTHSEALRRYALGASFDAISASMSGPPPSFARLANIAKTDPSIEEHPLANAASTITLHADRNRRFRLK